MPPQARLPERQHAKPQVELQQLDAGTTARVRARPAAGGRRLSYLSTSISLYLAGGRRLSALLAGDCRMSQAGPDGCTDHVQLRVAGPDHALQARPGWLPGLPLD